MIAFILSVALAAAAADPAVAAKPDAAKAEKTGKDGLVCKKEAVLGSRMKQRICLTEEEWEARKTAARDDLDAAQRNRPLNSN